MVAGSLPPKDHAGPCGSSQQGGCPPWPIRRVSTHAVAFVVVTGHDGGVRLLDLSHLAGLPQRRSRGVRGVHHQLFWIRQGSCSAVTVDRRQGFRGLNVVVAGPANEHWCRGGRDCHQARPEMGIRGASLLPAPASAVLTQWWVGCVHCGCRSKASLRIKPASYSPARISGAGPWRRVRRRRTPSVRPTTGRSCRVSTWLSTTTSRCHPPTGPDPSDPPLTLVAPAGPREAAHRQRQQHLRLHDGADPRRGRCRRARPGLHRLGQSPLREAQLPPHLR